MIYVKSALFAVFIALVATLAYVVVIVLAVTIRTRSPIAVSFDFPSLLKESPLYWALVVLSLLGGFLWQFLRTK